MGQILHNFAEIFLNLISRRKGKICEAKERNRNTGFLPFLKTVVVHVGLGIEADREWQDIERDLEQDLASVLPETDLISIKDLYLFGSLSLNNVVFQHLEEKRLNFH